MRYIATEGIIKKDINKLKLFGLALAYTVALTTSVIFNANAAQPSYSLFGDAAIVTGGNPGNAVQIRSDATIAPSFGGVSIVAPVTPWVDFDVLSTDYNVTDDSCGAARLGFKSESTRLVTVYLTEA